MATVERDGQWIHLYACEDHGEEPETLDPDEARDVARLLVEHADAVDADLATARAVCEREGHDWDGWNATKGPFGPKIYIEYCNRDLCDARRETDGWREVSTR